MKIQRDTRVLLPIGASVHSTKPMAEDFWLIHWDGPTVSKLKNWKIVPDFNSEVIFDTPNVSKPKGNGKFRTVSYASRILGFRSFATILTGKTVSYRWGRHTGKYTLKTGYVWKIDDLGLKIERLEDGGHYHPNGREFAEKGTFKSAQFWDFYNQKHGATNDYGGPNLLEDRCVRPEPKCHSKYQTGKLLPQYRGIMVTIADSITGGNCRGGTETFTQRLPESVRAKGEILSQNLLKYVQNPSEFGFVVRAVFAAKQRLRKLFSELAGNPVKVG